MVMLFTNLHVYVTKFIYILGTIDNKTRITSLRVFVQPQVRPILFSTSYWKNCSIYPRISHLVLIKIDTGFSLFSVTMSTDLSDVLLSVGTNKMFSYRVRLHTQSLLLRRPSIHSVQIKRQTLESIQSSLI